MQTKPMILAGVMSGTSLDGLDVAICRFSRTKAKYNYEILTARTFAYNAQWRHVLEHLHAADTQLFFKHHADYGRWIGETVRDFCKANGIKIEAVASHGHTVFHQPSRGFSVQVGSGADIAAVSGFTTVCDFRSLDVALGGQGAPLVPVGDRLLFPEAEACLNLGGIANISLNTAKNLKAFDICVANMALNYLARRKGGEYDRNGDWARTGKTDKSLLEQLNRHSFFQVKGAKSLGREWFESEMLPLLERGRPEDLLATCAEHTAMQIAAVVNDNRIDNMLVSGGGAFNGYLLERIRQHCHCKLMLPSEEVINFKEALIFAFLGYLRLNELNNTSAEVTGALRDSTGGAVYRA